MPVVFVSVEAWDFAWVMQCGGRYPLSRCEEVPELCSTFHQALFVAAITTYFTLTNTTFTLNQYLTTYNRQKVS